jgi:hypothetical protein
VNNKGHLTTCEFINSEWYEIHHWEHGYQTSNDLKLTHEELHINKLLQPDISSQGTPPEEVENLPFQELTKQSMESPIDNAMSLLSLGEELEEHIASTTVAMTQMVPPFAGYFIPTQPGTPAGPSGPEGPGEPGPGGPGGPGVPGGGGGQNPVMQNMVAPNGMKGNLPLTFNGDKKLYLPWKTELCLYQLTNQNHPTITNPTEKTLNAMGFICGLDMAMWVEDEFVLLEQCTAQWGDADP